MRVASAKTEIARSRLAPIREKPFATSQAAAARANRASASTGERERVVPESPVGRELGGGNEQHGGGGARRHHGGREAVDGRRPFDRGGALAPETAQLAVGLERRRPATSLEPRLPVLNEARQQRRQHDAADDLRYPAVTCPRSPDHPEARCGQEHDDECDQVGDVRAEPTALQPPRVHCPTSATFVTGR